MPPTEPILKQALKDDWELLAPVIQAHYSLAPFTNEEIRLEGKMHEVSHSRFAKLLIPFARVVGALIPYHGSNVPVRVVNHSRSDRTGYFWQRTFFFPGSKPFQFPSTILCTGDREIKEFVRFGFGIRLKLSVRNGGLIESDHGYVVKVGRATIPLPMNLLMGWASIQEMPVSESEFDMKMVLAHPLFGHMFAYNGRFALVRE